MILGETFTKDTMLFKFIGILRSLITAALHVKSSCRITELIEDLSIFCETNCESMKLIGRMTKNLKTLSKISLEIVNMMDDKKETQTIIEEVQKMQKLGLKTGEFL